MRAVIQRVSRAEVAVEGVLKGAIGRGLLIFLGVGRDDTDADLEWLVRKVPRIRCFDDADGLMNRSVLDVDGEAMVISQFTLFGTLRKGTRPSYNRAGAPDLAIPLYERFVERLADELDKPVSTGQFAKHMDIQAHNDGPVTLVLDTRQRDW